MEYAITSPSQMDDLSKLSVSVGNIPFIPNQSIASVMRLGDEIVGFAAVQAAIHAAGSWIHPDWRRQGHSYHLRSTLETELRKCGLSIYFAIPGNEFERVLFAKYGPVSERLVQVKELT